MKISAEARGGAPRGDGSASMSGQEGMLVTVSPRLGKIHNRQVHRAPWPAFEAFDVRQYEPELRRAAAIQWAGRARAEHGSVHQFSALTHALCEARAPLHILGALTRLQTDEVRHAEMCAAMALACYPEGVDDEPSIFAWPTPKAPWEDAPSSSDDACEIELWAANVTLSACCLGEALSTPMLDAIGLVTTDSVCQSVAQQILKDEHLHAAFGFELLGWLLPRLTDEGRASVQEQLRLALGSFESSTACGVTVADIANSGITIESAKPNLGTLTDSQYAMIFFATLEDIVFPQLVALGLDPMKAWAARGEGAVIPVTVPPTL
jgi:hypothetical protein